MTKKIKFNYGQLSLPFNDKAARTLSLSYELCERFFMALLCSCLISVAAYVYAVNATAHNVAARASLERESGELNAELASLEFQYIDLKSQVTMDTARELGFTEVREPVYVSKSPSSLSFNAVNR